MANEKVSKSNKVNGEKAAPMAEENKAAPQAPPPEPSATETPADAPNEKEQAERAAALEKAQSANNRVASKIASDWSKADKASKSWFLDMGERLHSLLAAEVAADKPYKVAMSDLVVRLRNATGEDKGADITRAIKTYFAAVVFGREPFGKIGIRAQKEFATLLDGAPDSNGVYVYSLKNEWADNGRKVFAVATGDDKESTLPEGMERMKEGTLTGDDTAKLVSAVKAGRNPLNLETKEAREARQKEEKAEREKEAKERAVKLLGLTNPGQGGAGKEETATGERPAPAGPLKLDIKPAVAGGEIVRLLAEHEEGGAIVLHAAAKAKEFSIDMIEAIVLGMGEANRISDMRRLMALLNRELSIAVMVETGKYTRKEALAEIEKRNERRAG